MKNFFIVAFMILAFVEQVIFNDIDKAIYFILWAILFAIIDKNQ